MDNKTLGFVGSGVLAAGTMMPIVSMPIVGSLNYLMNGKGDGTIVLLMAIASAVLIAVGKMRWLWLTAAVAACVSLFTLFRFINLRSEMEAHMERELADNPFRGLADAMLQTVQLQWGWVVIFAGIICLGVAAYHSGKGARAEEAVS